MSAIVNEYEILLSRVYQILLVSMKEHEIIRSQLFIKLRGLSYLVEYLV